MSHFYFDSSALVKRYLREPGSIWVRSLASPAAGHTIVVATITRVEVAAAFAARHRMPGGISRMQRDSALSLLLAHLSAHYQIAPLDNRTLSLAVNLTQVYRLRGYDAVQLATALSTNHLLISGGLPGLAFITADSDLLIAAEVEGLISDNPNHYP
jgi:predicted nucleic acid-binding protein